MIENYRQKECYNIYDLLEIIRLLRSSDGCPWDRVQTHESIKKNLIEETYEVIEAINKKDRDLLREELGDVLMQVVFHANLEEETGGFSFADVCDVICKKLINRHTHVFGQVSAETPESALNNWEERKKAEKGQQNQTDGMRSIPRELPALMRAEKAQKKAAKVGFDWTETGAVVKNLYGEIAELEEAVGLGNQSAIHEEFGDVLFSMVNLSRFLNADAEESLTRSTDKFIERFAVVEELALERGISMKDASLAELDELWGEAKVILKSK